MPAVRAMPVGPAVLRPERAAARGAPARPPGRVLPRQGGKRNWLELSGRAAADASTTTTERGASARAEVHAMTPAAPALITPDTAAILARWAGIPAAAELAAVFQAFHERVQRLYAIDVEAVEFDFLRPME